ncbi:MAG: DUF2157 domain-containing protein [Acidobacteriaceae bacterium]
MQTWEQYLARWQAAGIVDATTSERIRAFEAAQERPAGHRWQVLIALILGGILLGAGVLLFVAAHWDEVSPLQRLALVVGILALLHLGAIWATERFAGMATALHAVGTIGAGAAIAMVGQIFNMQEHWPAAVLLWALCAAAGWYWLRDQFQQVFLMLLAPAWLVCEWTYRASIYRGSEVYCLRMVAVLATVYLTAFIHSRRHAVFGILFAVSGIALLVTTTMLTEGWIQYSWIQQGHPVLPMGLRVAAIVIVLLMLAAGWVWERRSLVPALVVMAMSFVLPWLQVKIHIEYVHGDYTSYVPSVLAYVLIAAVCVFLAWWGVRERSPALVNYGIGAFALTVAWFYFSSLMDKLGRSLGLIGLGILFLAGGWLLERMRRRLLTRMNVEVPA